MGGKREGAWGGISHLVGNGGSCEAMGVRGPWGWGAQDTGA